MILAKELGFKPEKPEGQESTTFCLKRRETLEVWTLELATSLLRKVQSNSKGLELSTDLVPCDSLLNVHRVEILP